jgi:hypothetical protein
MFKGGMAGMMKKAQQMQDNMQQVAEALAICPLASLIALKIKSSNISLSFITLASI